MPARRGWSSSESAMVGRIVVVLIALVFLGLMAMAEAANPEVR